MSDSDDFIMEDEDFGSDDSENVFSPSITSPPHKHYKQGVLDDGRRSPVVKSSSSVEPQILTSGDIDEISKSLISDLREVISSLSEDEALIVLNKYGWEVSQVQQQWFEDNGKSVCTKAGIAPPTNLEIINLAEDPEYTCGICLSHPEDHQAMGLSGCHHMFCKTCYVEYVSDKVNEGQDSVLARCPAFKCPLVIPQSIFRTLLPPSLLSKYSDWMRNFFIVLNNKWTKWCPNPSGECGRAASRESASDSAHVGCACGYEWCWRCSLEFHTPVSCELARQWADKNSSESENVTWILANTKPCPKCRKPIERNQGCNHMHCPTRSGGCGAEFCWMCLGDWKSHSNRTGGFYRCNLFGESGSDVKDDLEAKRKESKAQLERYMFFFSRFMNHHKAGLLAKKELDTQSYNWMENLHGKLNLAVTDLEFIQEALIQVMSCRHVLKYTYVYGFYITDNSSKELFEYLQKNLEEFTDRLHEYIEKDLQQFLDQPKVDEPISSVRSGTPPTPSRSSTPPIVTPPEPIDVEEQRLKFFDFRSTVTNQCSVTRKFFKQIMEELTKVDGLGRSGSTF